LDIIPEFEFRRFIVEGVWDHGRSILLGPRTVDGVKGYDVITPFIREDGSTILVDRGFISRDHIQDQKPVGIHEPKGKVKIMGMLRMKLHNKNPFTPENRPEKGEWYFLDLDKMTQWFAAKDKSVQGIFLEELFGNHILV
jgi:surfeit locus 1 family protein